MPECNQYYQTKYDNKTFEEMLKLSQEFIYEIARTMLGFGYIVRPLDDKHPFIFPDNIDVRGLDVFAAKNGKPFFIDGKDYARLNYHIATGIPIKILDRYKIIQKETGIRACILFRDNKESEHSDPNYESIFKKGNYFIPYGNFLDDFSLYRKQGIPNKKGKTQVIWKYNDMKTISELFDGRIKCYQQLSLPGLGLLR